MNTTPLTPPLGAEFATLDLSRPLGAAAVKALLHALGSHGVIVVRGQSLAPASLATLCRSLGEPVEHPLEKFALPGLPEVVVLSNILDNGEPIGLADAGQRWRIDGAHLKQPHRATVLYAVEVPQQDGVPLGDTWFASTAAACDALDPLLRQQLQGMHAIHLHGAGRKNRSTPYFPDSGLTQSFRRGVEHPIIRTHPHSGRQCLYVNPLTTSHVRGMNGHDSNALLDQLYEHMARPEFAYRHQWQAGDVVLWDNTLTQHRNLTDYAWPQRRLLYRVQIKTLNAR